MDVREGLHVAVEKLLNNKNSSWYLTINKMHVCSKCIYNCMCQPIGVLESCTGVYSPCLAVNNQEIDLN